MKILLLALVLLLAGCTQWTVPDCRDGDPARPCVGVCAITLTDTQTVKVVPFAVKIRDSEGHEHCEEIKDL